MRALFIVKRRYGYESNCESYSHEMRSGLYNSAKFVSSMLDRAGIHSTVVDVIDNNCIEREVVKYKATHVFIEALWVVPEKMRVLSFLYPNVKWIVRIHSNTPFIANEGIAIDWIKGYAELGLSNVFIAPNSKSCLYDLSLIVPKDRLIYLPNYYQFSKKKHQTKHDDSIVKVGCFGSIRPLKNQLIQAIAAIGFADAINKKLEFHINSQRVEQRGNNALKNIRSLFKNSRHTLVEHEWLEHDAFLSVIGSMDINMQVSFTETFNIVSADSVSQFVPVVVCSDISWVNKQFSASPIDTADIIAKMKKVFNSDRNQITSFNWLSLHSYNTVSKMVWLRYLHIWSSYGS